MTESDAFARIVREVDRRGLGDLIDVHTVRGSTRWRWLALFERGEMAGYVSPDGVTVRNDIADAIRARAAREADRTDRRREHRAARAWGKSQGLAVGDGGPVPADVLDAYRLAIGKEVSP